VNTGIDIPRIDSEWKPLFRPDRTGDYINDHCFILGADGYWHLFGITKKGKTIDSRQERYFAHARGTELFSGGEFEEMEPVSDYGAPAWSPCVVEHDGCYSMFYSSFGCRCAVSHDLYRWHPKKIEIEMRFEKWRDPFLLRLPDSSWLMYATTKEGRYGQISVHRSKNLIEWHDVGYALRTSENAPYNPPWAATESPVVIEYNGHYYLSITYTDSSPDNYHNTLLFCSDDPYDFGEYTGDNHEEMVLATLHAHAPEYLYDPRDGRWYISTCGWPGRGIPHEGACSIARLTWERFNYSSSTESPAPASA
jgi:hypothetical protein